MANQINLYQSLRLNPSASTTELRKELQNKVAQLRESGMNEYEGPMQEATTALSILGNDTRRKIYDKRLNDPSQLPISIADLRALAATSFAEPTPPTAENDERSSAEPAQSAQPETDLFITQSQESNSSPNHAQPNHVQPNHAQAPNPAAGSPTSSAPTPGFPAPQKVAYQIAPAPDDASIKYLWSRMQATMPRILFGLISFQAIIGLLMLLMSLWDAATLSSEPDSAGLVGALDFVMSFLVKMATIPIASISGIVITAISVFFAYALLKGKQANFAPLFTAVMVPVALYYLTIGILLLNIEETALGIVSILIMATVVAAIVIALLPEIRHWFKNEILLPAQQPQMQPAAANNWTPNNWASAGWSQPQPQQDQPQQDKSQPEK